MPGRAELSCELPFDQVLSLSSYQSFMDASESVDYDEGRIILLPYLLSDSDDSHSFPLFIYLFLYTNV